MRCAPAKPCKIRCHRLVADHRPKKPCKGLFHVEAATPLWHPAPSCPLLFLPNRVWHNVQSTQSFLRWRLRWLCCQLAAQPGRVPASFCRILPGNAQCIGLPLNRYTDSVSKAPSRNCGLPRRKNPLQGLLLGDCKFQAVALRTMTSCLAQRCAKRAVAALRSTVESACALIALDGRVKPHLDDIDGRHRGLTGMPSQRFCEN